MEPVVYELAFGLLLGFSLTIPPGPMNAYIVAQSVRSFREGVTTGFGAMCADLTLGILVFGLDSVVDLADWIRWIYLLGAVVMAALGYSLVRGAREAPPPETHGLRTFTKAYAIGLSNPFQIIWWLTVGLAFAYLGGWVLFVGLFGAIALWIVVLAWAVHRGTEGSRRAGQYAIAISGVLVFAFAAYFVYLAVT